MSDLSALTAADLNKRISAALAFPQADEADMLPHLRWAVLEILDHVGPEDFSAAELMALLAVLTPVHARVLGGSPPPLAPVLRVVGDAAAEFGD
jgi:hypothetical protein